LTGPDLAAVSFCWARPFVSCADHSVRPT